MPYFPRQCPCTEKSDHRVRVWMDVAIAVLSLRAQGRTGNFCTLLVKLRYILNSAIDNL